MRRLSLLALLGVASLWGQGDVSLSMSADPPAPVNNISASIIGNIGSNQFVYHVIARYPIGLSSPRNFTLINAPNLTVSNNALITWSPATGATGYDLLKFTVQQSQPIPCNSCLLASNISATSFTDTGQALTNYNPSPGVATQVSATISINNRDFTAPRIIFNPNYFVGVGGLAFPDGTTQTTAGGGAALSLTGTSPIVVTPNPITGTGVISCPTCGIAGSGVTSLNALTGALTVAAGTGISVGAAGSTITVNNTGVTSLNAATGALTNTGGSGITVGTVGTTVTTSVNYANFEAGLPWFCADTSGTNASTCSLSAAQILSGYIDGMFILWEPGATNLAACPTVAVDGLAAVQVTLSDGSTCPSAGTITAGMEIWLTYDGSHFREQLPGPNMTLPGNVSAGGSVSAGVGSGVSGLFFCGAGTPHAAIGAGQFGFGCPATLTSPLEIDPPNAQPTANQFMLFPAPTSNISQWAWFSMPTSAAVLGTSAANLPIAADANAVNGVSYVAGGGVADTQTATLSPAITALTAGKTRIFWLPIAANATTTPTLNVNGLGAKTIIKVGGVALAASDLTTTAIAFAIYDGTNFELQNPQTSVAGSTAFSAITAGTNTAALVMGTGGTLGVSGTGTITATNAIFPMTVSGTVNSGGIPCFNSATNMQSSAALTTNAIVVGQGAGACVSVATGLAVISGIIRGTTSTSATQFQGGIDGALSGVQGGVVIKGGFQTGAGNATSQGGSALLESGSNAGTNAASVGGTVEIAAGQSTGATPGLQGLTLISKAQAQGATVTQWNLQCTSSTTAMTAADCAANPTNILGVNVSKSTTISQGIAGIGSFVPINAPAAVTVGHTVCAGATAGQVTDSAGTGACSVGFIVGIVRAITGTWPAYPDGTAFPALSTTLPLVEITNLTGPSYSVGVSGNAAHSTSVVIGSGTSIGSTSLCSTTVCPAGTYQVDVYLDITTACGTSGTYIVNLIYTDDQGSKTTVMNINGTGSVPSTGTLTTTSTGNFGQESQVIRSTGAASINYSTTATACGTAGPMVGNMYLSVVPLM